MAKRRLLWFTENYPPQRGGMAQSCDRIVNGLRKRGIQVDLIHFTNKGTSISSQQQQNGSYTAIPYLDSEPHTLNITWNYIQDLGDYDYFVCFGGYLSMIGTPLFSLWSSTKLITMIRGNDFDHSVFTPRKRTILEDVFKQSSHVLTVSSDKADKVSKWLPSVKATFLANGIDLSLWHPTASEQTFATEWKNENASGKICMGLIGQLKPKKGIRFFIDALSRTRFAENTHLLLVGDLEEELIAYLEALKISYSSLPFHDRYELLKYYLACDAIVIPSFYDGMPNVMLEAGALGIPVIASDVDGMKDVISDKKDGWLFKVGNEDACKRALYHFHEIGEESRKTIGESLKLKIETNYTESHETDSILSIIY